MAMDKADRIIKAIETDFTDRRGLRQEWEQIDGEIKKEIRAEWKRLICEELAKAETNQKEQSMAAEITTEEFDRALISILEGMTAANLIRIPGVYEIVSEELNNEALDLVNQTREQDKDETPEPPIAYYEERDGGDCGMCGI